MTMRQKRQLKKLKLVIYIQNLVQLMIFHTWKNKNLKDCNFNISNVYNFKTTTCMDQNFYPTFNIQSSHYKNVIHIKVLFVKIKLKLKNISMVNKSRLYIQTNSLTPKYMKTISKLFIIVSKEFTLI